MEVNGALTSHTGTGLCAYWLCGGFHRVTAHFVLNFVLVMNVDGLLSEETRSETERPGLPLSALTGRVPFHPRNPLIRLGHTVHPIPQCTAAAACFWRDPRWPCVAKWSVFWDGSGR